MKCEVKIVVGFNVFLLIDAAGSHVVKNRNHPGRIYLLCPGNSIQDEIKRYQGFSGSVLNSEGRSQAQHWRREFSNIHLRQIFCSDLMRSYETANTIARGKNLRLQSLTKLREINMGAWDGQRIEDIRRMFPAEHEKRDKNMVYYRPPGGECFADVAARVIPLFMGIINGLSGNVLIVSHAGVNKVLLCHILGMRLENLFRLQQDYGCLNVISACAEGFQLEKMNVNSFRL